MRLRGTRIQSKYAYLVRFIEELINRSTGIPSPLLKKGKFYKYLSVAIETSLIGSFTLLLILYSLTTTSLMIRAIHDDPKTEPLSVLAASIKQLVASIRQLSTSIDHLNASILQLHRADTVHILFLAIEIFLAVLIFILEIKIEKIDFNFIVNRPSALWLYNIVKKSAISGKKSRAGTGYNGYDYEVLASIFSGEYNYSARAVMENVILLFIYFIILLFMVENDLGWNPYLVLTTGIILTMPIIAEVLANLTDPGRIIYGAVSYVYKPAHFFENLRSNSYLNFVVIPNAVLISYYIVLLHSIFNNMGRLLPAPIKLIIFIQIFFIIFTYISFISTVLYKEAFMASPSAAGLYFFILVVSILFVSPAIYYLTGYPLFLPLVVLSALFATTIVLNYMMYFGVMCEHSSKRLPPWCWVKIRVGKRSIIRGKIRKISLSDYYRLYASYLLDSLASSKEAEFTYYGFEIASIGFVELVLEWSALSSIKPQDIKLIRDSDLVGLMKILLNRVAEEEISDLLTILVFEVAVISLIRLEKSRGAEAMSIAGYGGNLIYLSTSLLLAFVISAFIYEYYKNTNRRTLQIIRRLRILMLPMMTATRRFVSKCSVEGLLTGLKTLQEKRLQVGATWDLEVAVATLEKLFRALYNIKPSSC